MHPKLQEVAGIANDWAGRRHVAEVLAATMLLVGIESLALKAETQDRPQQVVAAAVGACATEPCSKIVPVALRVPKAVAEAVPETSTTTTLPAATTTTTSPPAETLLSASSVQTDPRARGAIGVDQSWANCDVPLKPGILFGIIGVTDGESFETNRCLTQLADKFRAVNIEPALYINVDLEWENAVAENSDAVPCPEVFPLEVCPAYRWGYRGGAYAVQAAWDQGISSKEWYLDVEHNNDWTGNTDLNRLAILGTMDAVRNEAGRLMGIPPAEIYEAIYTNPSAWKKITSNLQLPVHTWLATGSPEAELLKYCDDPFYNLTGGGVIMVQTVDQLNPGGPIDINARC